MANHTLQDKIDIDKLLRERVDKVKEQLFDPMDQSEHLGMLKEKNKRVEEELYAKTNKELKDRTENAEELLFDMMGRAERAEKLLYITEGGIKLSNDVIKDKMCQANVSKAMIHGEYIGSCRSLLNILILQL